jgi:hypothetical protein
METVCLREFTFAELLLQKEPTNLQAQSLGGLIDQQVAQGSFLRNPLWVLKGYTLIIPSFPPFFSRHLYLSSLLFFPLPRLKQTEGYIGMAIAGGAALVGTLLLAGIVRRATRK